MAVQPPPPEPRPRGRPRSENPPDQVIKVSLTAEEYAWVVARARVHDLPLADYCRRKVLGRSVPADELGATSSGFWQPNGTQVPGQPNA
jgi:hypothetical protein